MKSITWIVVAVIIGALAGGYFSLKPWTEFNAQRVKRDHAVAQLKQAEIQRAELIKVNAKLKSSLGMEELSRNSKYLKPDEKPIEVGE